VILALLNGARWLVAAKRVFGMSEKPLVRRCGILMDAAQSRFFPVWFPFLHLSQFLPVRQALTLPCKRLPESRHRLGQVAVTALSLWFAV
jgi:hypothetical protein